MSVGERVPGRTRAWILIQTDLPHDVAWRIYDELGKEGEDHFVLVRADVVVDSPFSIVVPVDAESPDWLQHVQDRIQHIGGVRQMATLRVVEHVPWPPHIAEGFITPEEEAAAGIEEVGHPGRQHHSPGLNAWG